MEDRAWFPRWPGVTVAALSLAVLAGCGADNGGQPAAESPGTQPSPSSSATVTPGPLPPATTTPQPPQSSGPAVPGTVPPAWLGRRVLPRQANGFGEIRPTPRELVRRRFTLPDRVAALPGRGFASRVSTPAPRDVLARSTWRPGCPVAATELSWVRVAFWGFDDRRHTGELLLATAVAADIVEVFRGLYRERFPIEEMRITRAEELTAPPTGDGNNTGAFTCRPTTGASSYSEHAYGLALDLNPFHNPYTKGDVVLPELASAFLSRDRERPGMIAAGSSVVAAFAAIGWEWGGAWRTLKDYQHFSLRGR